MKKLFLFLLIIESNLLSAQDSSISKTQVELSGYIKEMFRLQFDQYSNNSLVALTHNRVNVTWKHDSTLIGRFEWRTRWFMGDDPIGSPDFAASLKNKNDFLQLSATICNQNNTCLFTNIERLSLEYRKKKWNLRMGRQRINWGMNNFWNPNDIFNAGNYFDFDYEEKPGTDAVKMQLLHRRFSNTEIALGLAGKKPVMGVKYFTNYRKYDLQLIAGVYKNRFTAGFGWAGHIADLGFKGEIQYFDEVRNQTINISTEVDYVFKKGWYLSLGFLFNDYKQNNGYTPESLIDFEVSPLTLMPARYNYILNTEKEINPLLKITVTGLYINTPEMYMLSGGLSYDVADNLTLNLISQTSFGMIKGIDLQQTNVFIRLKYNF